MEEYLFMINIKCQTVLGTKKHKQQVMSNKTNQNNASKKVRIKHLMEANYKLFKRNVNQNIITRLCL